MIRCGGDGQQPGRRNVKRNWSQRGVLRVFQVFWKCAWLGWGVCGGEKLLTRGAAEVGCCEGEEKPC